MKGIVFLGNRQCAVKEVPTPEPGNGEVRIQMKVSGICGSDLHVYRPPAPRDWVQGHESSGVVEKLGPNVTNLKVGGPCNRPSPSRVWTVLLLFIGRFRLVPGR